MALPGSIITSALQHWTGAMTESNQTPAVPLSVSKEKKAKIFYEHGKVSRAIEALVLLDDRSLFAPMPTGCIGARAFGS